MGATSAQVENANLRGQIDGMERGMNRMQGMPGMNFMQGGFSNFMSSFAGSFMGASCASMMNHCFPQMGFGGFGGYGGYGFGRFGF